MTTSTANEDKLERDLNAIMPGRVPGSRMYSMPANAVTPDVARNPDQRRVLLARYYTALEVLTDTQLAEVIPLLTDLVGILRAFPPGSLTTITITNDTNSRDCTCGATH